MQQQTHKPTTQTRKALPLTPRLSKFECLCTDEQLQEFITFLKSKQLIVRLDTDDMVTLSVPDPICDDPDAVVEIADMCEPCVVRFNNQGAYVECSLDYGNGMDVSDSMEAEIPLMKLRLYPMELFHGVIRRKTSHTTFEALVDEMTGCVSLLRSGSICTKRRRNHCQALGSEVRHHQRQATNNQNNQIQGRSMK